VAFPTVVVAFPTVVVAFPTVGVVFPVVGGARRIELDGLTSGTAYMVRVRGVGGSTKYSPWSDPITRVAT
jgi:hypothetical protein